jgi:hypothetical protein
MNDGRRSDDYEAKIFVRCCDICDVRISPFFGRIFGQRKMSAARHALNLELLRPVALFTFPLILEVPK